MKKPRLSYYSVFLYIIFVLSVAVLVFASLFNASGQASGPEVVRADCNWVVVGWTRPYAPPDIQFPGGAYVWDGHELKHIDFVILRGGPDWRWAGYIGDLDPEKNGEEWVVESAWIYVADDGNTPAWATNTPYPVSCERIYMPDISLGVVR